MIDFSKMFGVTPAEEAKSEDMAAGYMVGAKAAADVHVLINKEHADKSRAFREGILEALREHL